MSHSASPGPQKVKEIWFEDGNLIIIADNKIFRLYQGLVAQRSIIFKDMLAIPQSDSSRTITDADQEAIDTLGLDVTGCAVVRLTDDAKEVEWFLSTFSGNSLWTTWKGTHQYSNNVQALTGILRLATKYEVESLQSWAVLSLERVFPLQPHVRTLNRDLQRKENTTFDNPDTTWMNGLFPLIDTALMVGVPWILPRVYWRLRRATLGEILSHPEWANFSEAHRHEFLLGREAAQVVVVNDFALVLRLHRAYDMGLLCHINTTCLVRFREVALRVLVQDGPRGHESGDESFTWGEYWKLCEGSCICRQTYKRQRGEMIKDAFSAVQRHHGLPDNAALTEMRNMYHSEKTV